MAQAEPLLLPRELLVRTGPVDHADWNYKGILGRISRQRFKLVRRLMDGQRFPRLLELGYGSGVFLPELARHADAVSGVDVHGQSEEVASALARNGVTVTLKRGVAESLPFADESFDAVVAVSVLEFVDDMDMTARELGRVLAPGGALIVITPGKSPLVDAGLKLLTGKSADADFGNKRERVIPALKRAFRLDRELQFPFVTVPGVRLYTALRFGKA